MLQGPPRNYYSKIMKIYNPQKRRPLCKFCDIVNSFLHSIFTGYEVGLLSWLDT